MSCRRAISATATPALSVSATTRPFSCAVQRRRRPIPVRISTRPHASFVSHISVGHMCETFPPNQREACDIPRASIKVRSENRLQSLWEAHHKKCFYCGCELLCRRCVFGKLILCSELTSGASPPSIAHAPGGAPPGNYHLDIRFRICAQRNFLSRAFHTSVKPSHRWRRRS
jgi:hypothetical protein